MYTFRTEPFAHQRTEFDATHDREYWGLLWEMGVAKTKVLIDTASWMWLQGKIDGVLILAPEGVHSQWINDEIPDHMPLQVMDSLDSFIWSTSKADNKGFTENWDRFFKRPRAAGLSALTMTYDSLMTEKGAQAAKKFLTSRRVLLILDESTKIKSPGAKVTKRVLAMSKYAPYRRIANGTPVADSPYNCYAQVKFLNQTAWHHLGIKDFAAFETYFGVYERRELKVPRMVNGGRKKMTHFDHLVAYKNLADMAEVLAKHGSRLLKKDVFPNLPPKLFSKVYFDLTPKQRKAYTDLKEEYRTWLADGGLVTADLAIVRQTRLAQICSGYLPCDNEDDLTCLVEPKDNPRLNLLAETVEDIGGKFIVWARYDIDIDLIAAHLRSLGIPTVQWDGRTSKSDRETAKARFRDPAGARAFLGKASSTAARGLNLQVADTVIYYNNSFVLDDRLQSEDRAHRPGIHHPVKYIDLIGKSTIDGYIIDSLKKKRDVAAIVTGDLLDAWL